MGSLDKDLDKLEDGLDKVADGMEDDVHDVTRGLDDEFAEESKGPVVIGQKERMTHTRVKHREVLKSKNRFIDVKQDLWKFDGSIAPG